MTARINWLEWGQNRNQARCQIVQKRQDFMAVIPVIKGSIKKRG